MIVPGLRNAALRINIVFVQGYSMLLMALLFWKERNK